MKVWMLFSVDNEVGAEDALYAYSSPEECLAHQGVDTTVPPSSLPTAVFTKAMHGQSWFYRNTDEYRAEMLRFINTCFSHEDTAEDNLPNRPHRDVVRIYLWNAIEEQHEELVLRPFIIDEFARSTT